MWGTPAAPWPSVPHFAPSRVSLEMLFKNTVPRSSMTLLNISGVKLALATYASAVPTEKSGYEGQNIL